MTEFLKIGKSGFELYSYNHERASEFKFRMDGDRYVIKDQDGKIVKDFSTSEDRDLYFYEQSSVINPFTKLREIVFVHEKETTIGDLIRAIQQDQALLDLVKALCGPDFPKIRNFKEDIESSEVLILRRVANIDVHGKFTTGFDIGYTNNRNFTSETALWLDDCVISDKEKLIGWGNYNFSLYELIQGIFGTQDEEQLVLSKTGITVDGQPFPKSPNLSLLPFLNCVTKIEEDVTLGDIFNLVKDDERLVEFFRRYSWCNEIQEFHRLAERPVQQEDYWHLQINRKVIVPEDGVGNPIDFDANFSAVGEVSKMQMAIFDQELNLLKNVASTDKKEIEELESQRPAYSTYGISGDSVDQLASLPVHLNTELNFIVFNSKSRKVIKSEVYTTDYTLLNILDSIYWEVSFFGPPSTENRKTMAESLEETITKISDGDLSNS